MSDAPPREAVPSDLPLDGRHALVTGGGSGIGRAVAQRLSAAGAVVSLLGRRPGPLEEALAGLDRPGAWAQADVTDATGTAAALAAIAEAQGPLDVLVCNAGAAESAPFGETDSALWEAMLAVNLTGVFNTLRPVLPAMQGRGWGRVVAVASTAGLKGYPYVAAYCAAKHGVLGLVRALALETARDGVTVNALCPGFTETDLLERSLARIEAATGRGREDAAARLKAANPQGRFVAPEEVAEAVLWLALPASGAVTGQAISVSGGEVM